MIKYLIKVKAYLKLFIYNTIQSGAGADERNRDEVFSKVSFRSRLWREEN
jgi:hypothetical protein